MQIHEFIYAHSGRHTGGYTYVKNDIGTDELFNRFLCDIADVSLPSIRYSPLENEEYLLLYITPVSGSKTEERKQFIAHGYVFDKEAADQLMEDYLPYIPNFKHYVEPDTVDKAKRELSWERLKDEPCNQQSIDDKTQKMYLACLLEEDVCLLHIIENEKCQENVETLLSILRDFPTETRKSLSWNSRGISFKDSQKYRISVITRETYASIVRSNYDGLQLGKKILIFEGGELVDEKGKARIFKTACENYPNEALFEILESDDCDIEKVRERIQNGMPEAEISEKKEPRKRQNKKTIKKCKSFLLQEVLLEVGWCLVFISLFILLLGLIEIQTIGESELVLRISANNLSVLLAFVDGLFMHIIFDIKKRKNKKKSTGKRKRRV